VTAKWRNPVRIADAIAGMFARLGIEARLREHEVFRVWPAAVGPAIARHAEPQSLKQGRLLVHATDSVWLHQLSMMRHRILDALNGRLGAGSVRELVLRVGEVAPHPGPAPAPSSASVPPDPVRLQEIEIMLAPLKDEETRAAFRRLLLRHDEIGPR
jgi:predicted nucleic acid-binding Zn ribbon protein